MASEPPLSFDGPGLFGPSNETWSNTATQPLTPESMEAAIDAWRKLEERILQDPDPTVVPPSVFRCMEAVRRKFPKATDDQCLEAALSSDSGEDAIAAFAEISQTSRR